ncbi:hypothetical protein L6452_25258 [Arctium lappa]|uniref:Uncharacterized protein n=1 Tax=Arctium lappa TaxID=4217 RepID=A0ACB9AC44_ARCLA|nr:hypothetical protein L6452_25258 [Arctium lappa]
MHFRQSSTGIQRQTVRGTLLDPTTMLTRKELKEADMKEIGMKGKDLKGRDLKGRDKRRRNLMREDIRQKETDWNRRNRKKGSTKLKDQVRNSVFYKNKMLLAKQQEAGKVLMAEDEYWLDHSDEEEDEEENYEAVNMCLMGKIESDTEADSENEEEEI